MIEGVLVGGIFALVGAPILWVGLRVIRRDRAIGRWPRAPGTIISSSVASQGYTSRDADGYDVSGTSYTPNIRYRYEVAGRTFQGEKVTRAPAVTNDGARAQGLLDRYSVGKQVEVLHDPNDPAMAYLETSISGGAIFLTIFGGLFVLAGTLVVSLVLLFG